MRVATLCCLLLAGFVACHGQKSYRGHQVLAVKATNEHQLTVLRNLRNNNLDLLFMDEPTLVVGTEIVVPPSDLAMVMDALTSAGLSPTLVTADLQADFDSVMEENTANKLKNARAGVNQKNGRFSPPHDVYYTPYEVNDILWFFERDYPDLIRFKQLPYGTENSSEPIFYIEMGERGNSSEEDGGQGKPVIFIEGLAHAREWIVTASLIYTIDMMLSGYVAGDQWIVDVMQKYTWVIIPMVNPEGYAYTWTNDRMWRKNRKFINNQCAGVDLNRNYDVDFGNVGVSTNCRSDVWPGFGPFTESETRNVFELFYEYNEGGNRVVSFLSVHAYSQLLLYPWGYVNSNYDPSPPGNLDELIYVGALMRNALHSVDQREFLLGTAYGVLGYAASGAAEDWALHVKPGIYAYCYELRPRTSSQGGFVISPSNIVTSGEELLQSLLVLADNIVEGTSSKEVEEEEGK